MGIDVITERLVCLFLHKTYIVGFNVKYLADVIQRSTHNLHFCLEFAELSLNYLKMLV